MYRHRHLASMALLIMLAAALGFQPGDPARKDAMLRRFTEEFVLLTPGKGHFPDSFVLGSDGVAPESEKPAVKITFRASFALARYEVTQELYEAIMGRTPSRWKGPRNSVEMVSWEEANDFCGKVTQELRRRKLLGEKEIIRLPSEAEWEYACRGGALAKENGPQCSYHFYLDKPTYDLSSYRANFNGNYPFGNASRGPFLQRPTRVGAYPPNQLGLCDMHGNVRQWCDDLEDEPREGSFRVVRGGSWRSPGESCRVASRGRQKPSEWSNALGVRLARVPVR